MSTEPAVSRGDSRGVSNADLKILSLQIDNKLDLLSAQLSAIQLWQTEYRVKIAATDEEIVRLRERSHEMANAIQQIELRTAPISRDTCVDLVQLLPLIKQGTEVVKRRDLRDALSHEEQTWVRQAMIREQEREERWFGMSRETLFFVLGGIFLILLHFAPSHL